MKPVPNVVTAITSAVYANESAVSLSPEQSWDDATGGESNQFVIHFGRFTQVGVSINIHMFGNSDDVSVYLSHGDLTFSNFKTKKDVKNPKGIASMLAQLEEEIPKYKRIETTLRELNDYGKDIPEKSPAAFLKKLFFFQKDELAVGIVDTRNGRIIIKLIISGEGNLNLRVENYPLKDMAEASGIADMLTENVIQEHAYFSRLVKFDVNGAFYGGDGGHKDKAGLELQMSFDAIIPPKIIYAVMVRMGFTRADKAAA